MKLFKCSHSFTVEVVDLPRHSWKVLPPAKWQVVLTVAGIVLAAVVWAIL